MTLPVVLRDEASAEFDDGFDWYDAKEIGLGPAFASEVKIVFDRIAANPLMHGIVRADIRKAIVKRSPYSVFYRPHADRIEVIAVFHSSRDPADWHSRV